MTQYILLVGNAADSLADNPPVAYGPFGWKDDAVTFAENYRRAAGLPVEATPENNEKWTAVGFWFGIVPLATSFTVV